MNNDNTSPDSGQPPREAGHQLFDWIRSTGLQRSSSGWAGGVFGSLANQLGWDAALVRGIGALAFILFFSPTALLYGLAWLLVPDAEGKIHLQQAIRGVFSSGFWGGAVLAAAGAINVFTPISLAGPFAILLNLTILGVVGGVIWWLFSGNDDDDSAEEDQAGDSGKAEGRKPNQDSSESAEKPAPRADGKPAWYPKESAADEQRPTRQAPAAPAAVAPTAAAPAAQEDPGETEEQRRRRLLNMGLGLLSLTLIGGAVYAAMVLGVNTATAVVVALAILVSLLAVTQIFSGLRGKQGRSGLLITLTAAMLVTFSVQGSDFSNSSNYAFGNYTTESSSVNTAFSNTTVDLRQLSAEATGTEGYYESVELNQAFGNLTVVVPDDAAVSVSNGQVLGNLNISTRNTWQEESGFTGGDASISPPNADETAGEIDIQINAALGRVEIYDATSYALAEDGRLQSPEDSADEFPDYQEWLDETGNDDSGESYQRWLDLQSQWEDENDE